MGNVPRGEDVRGGKGLQETLPKMFQKGKIENRGPSTSPSEDDEKWTVALSKDKCTVKAGKARGRRRLLLQGVPAAVPGRLERRPHAFGEGLPAGHNQEQQPDDAQGVRLGLPQGLTPPPQSR
jgi:hypothetical protein